MRTQGRRKEGREDRGERRGRGRQTRAEMGGREGKERKQKLTGRLSRDAASLQGAPRLAEPLAEQPASSREESPATCPAQAPKPPLRLTGDDPRADDGQPTQPERRQERSGAEAGALRAQKRPTAGTTERRPQPLPLSLRVYIRGECAVPGHALQDASAAPA